MALIKCYTNAKWSFAVYVLKCTKIGVYRYTSQFSKDECLKLDSKLFSLWPGKHISHKALFCQKNVHVFFSQIMLLVLIRSALLRQSEEYLQHIFHGEIRFILILLYETMGIVTHTHTHTHKPALVAQLDAPSDWRPGGCEFNPTPTPPPPHPPPTYFS